MTHLVFFYGTLMSGFKRPGRERLNSMLTPLGRGSIRAALFDMGFYPAAVPAGDAQVVWSTANRASAPSACCAFARPSSCANWLKPSSSWELSKSRGSAAPAFTWAEIASF